MVKFYDNMSPKRLETLKSSDNVIYAGLTSELDMSVKSAMMLPADHKKYCVMTRDEEEIEIQIKVK